MTTLFMLAALSSSAMAAECPMTDTELLSPGSQTGDNSLADASFDPSCGDAGAPDVVYEFTAPADGVYLFQTAGSSFDTVLALVDTSDCSTELACNDDDLSRSDLSSLIAADLTAGQNVAVVIQGFQGASGPFELTISRLLQSCLVDMDAGSAEGPGVMTGSTCGAADDLTVATCGDVILSPDITIGWTAPAAGSYTFSTVGSDFDTLIVAQDDQCGELACNDDGFSGRTSAVTVDMADGEEIWLTVDAYANGCGNFVLNVAESACADADGDAVCDGNDVCQGYDLAGDTDLDGVCDDLDGCIGDDGSGDGDFDGICNSDDFTLQQTTATPGSQMTMTVERAMPGSTVYFMASPGLSVPVCHPAVDSVCTYLRRPIVLGTAPANAAGEAGLTVTVPQVPTGTTFYTQAAWFTNGDGDVSQRIEDMVE